MGILLAVLSGEGEGVGPVGLGLLGVLLFVAAPPIAFSPHLHQLRLHLSG